MDEFYPNKQLKILIDSHFGGNATELTKILQMSRQSLDDYLNMKSAIGMKFKKKLVELAKINPKWLDYGDGEMFLSDNSNSIYQEPKTDKNNVGEEVKEYSVKIFEPTHLHAGDVEAHKQEFVNTTSEMQLVNFLRNAIDECKNYDELVKVINIYLKLYKK
jgi:hypothetical protein